MYMYMYIYIYMYIYNKVIIMLLGGIISLITVAIFFLDINICTCEIK